MKTLYLECGMGAAGDMLTAALLELMPDPDAAVAELNGLGIPGVQFSKEAVSKLNRRNPYDREGAWGGRVRGDVPSPS